MRTSTLVNVASNLSADTDVIPKFQNPRVCRVRGGMPYIQNTETGNRREE